MRGGVLFFFTVEVVAVEEDELLGDEGVGVDAAESFFFFLGDIIPCYVARDVVYIFHY